MRLALLVVTAGFAGCEAQKSTAPGPVVQAGEARPLAVNPLASFAFYVDHSSKAQQTVDGWKSTRPADATEMEKIATQPVARWLGNWNSNIRGDVANAVAASGSTVPVLVAYNIPQRDCGSYSGGNGTTPDSYRAWIQGFANGLGDARAVVVLEPDALPGMDCLSAADQATRIDLIKFAVSALSSDPNAKVYIDAGNPNWKSASTMADRLIRAGIASAAGFSLNVSNFYRDADNIAFGTQLSGLLGGKHYIVDTGRNGLGPTSDYQWCNPAGRAIGQRPTTATGNPLVDAFLWIKTPGESDGSCNGAPAAGTWMPVYALGLAQRG